jgi:transcriptional regulator with XRE-family HTH domain
MSVGSRIRYCRAMRKLTRAELATAMNLPRNTLFAWEHDQKSPSPDVILQLCRALDVSVDDILKDASNEHLAIHVRFDLGLEAAVDEIIKAALQSCGGNINQTAKLLRITQRRVRKHLSARGTQREEQ